MSSKFHSPRVAFSPEAALSPSPPDLGALPKCRLQDLYEGMDSPSFSADLQRAEGQAKLFAEAYRGKLAALADRPDAGETLAAAVQAYESLQDLTGRIMAYASLLYASDTCNPRIAKFYGDAQERVTALAGDVLFFELELNRLDDSKLNAAMAAPALGHYRPWLEDIRKEKPHQLADDLARRFGKRRPTLLPRRLAPTCVSLRSSPIRWPRTRRPPIAGASSATSPIRATSPTGWSPKLSRRWLRQSRTPIRGFRIAITR